MKKIPVAMAWMAVVAGAVQAQGTEPDADETLRWHVRADAQHDSNVRRTPDASADEIGILAAGLRLDKRYSLQRITLEAEASRFAFRDLSGLDYSTLTYNAAWNFQFTPRLQGVVRAERRQYRDITNVDGAAADLDLRTERDDRAEATFLPGGGWRTLAGISRTSSRSDEPRALEASPTVNSVHVGGGYEFPSGALLTGQVRRGDGDYGGALAGPDFRETEPSVALRWPVTAKSTIDARLGYLERDHDAETERDFKGLVGTSALRWEFSPRTSLEAGLARDLGSYEFAGGGFIRGWRLFLAPVWRPSDKTVVRLRHARETRDWRVASPASPDALREDRTRWNSVTLEWTPRRWVSLTALARHERRNSSLPSQDFRATVFALGARLNF